MCPFVHPHIVVHENLHDYTGLSRLGANAHVQFQSSADKSTSLSLGWRFRQPCGVARMIWLIESCGSVARLTSQNVTPDELGELRSCLEVLEQVALGAEIPPARHVSGNPWSISCQMWPISTNIGPSSAKIWECFSQVWSNAKCCQVCPNRSQHWSRSALVSARELARFASSNYPRDVASNFCATSG